MATNGDSATDGRIPQVVISRCETVHLLHGADDVGTSRVAAPVEQGTSDDVGRLATVGMSLDDVADDVIRGRSGRSGSGLDGALPTEWVSHWFAFPSSNQSHDPEIVGKAKTRCFIFTLSSESDAHFYAPRSFPMP
jgi:hypothetical protein